MPKPEKKGVESNHYLEQIAQNHLILREEIKQFGAQLPYIKDSAAYFEAFSPFMMRMDSIMFSIPNDSLLTETDSFVVSLNERLYADYAQIIHIKFREMHGIYRNAGDTLNQEEQERVDQIWATIDEMDKLSITTFEKYFPIDSATFSKFRSLLPPS